MFYKHTALYYRNTILVWVSTALVFLGMLLRSNHWFTTLWLIPAVYLIFNLWGIYRMVHPRRRALLRRWTPKDAGLTYEEVNFPGREGNPLAGWYIPGHNRRAVILVHGLGGSGATMVEHARLLSTAGYGVLLLDLRAHGFSAGDTATFGIREGEDVLGALDYLWTRSDVDADKVGAMGISLGAQAVLRAARKTQALCALALEGLGPTTLADHGRPMTADHGRPMTAGPMTAGPMTAGPMTAGLKATWRRWVNRPLNAFFYEMGNLMSATWPENGTRAALAGLSPRPLLLISTGRGWEQAFMRLFYQEANQPKTLWEVERAAHAGAYAVRKKEYRERLLRLFDQALQ